MIHLNNNVINLHYLCTLLLIWFIDIACLLGSKLGACGSRRGDTFEKVRFWSALQYKMFIFTVNFIKLINIEDLTESFRNRAWLSIPTYVYEYSNKDNVTHSTPTNLF